MAALLAGAVLPAAAPVHAADPALPRPIAAVEFLSAITFTGTARLDGPVRRLEIVVGIEGSSRALVAEVAAPGASGEVGLRYVLETPGGSIYPNTEVTARFRATLDDGRFADGPSVVVQYADTRFEWRSVRGDLVAVHWVEGDTAFGRRALRIGEDSVRSAGDLFGVTESEPIDFFVYPDEASFYDVIGAASRENVGGTALPEIRTLYAKIEPDRIDDPWVGIVIPHELTHIVFSSATGNPYHEPLHWLDEGIAVYLAEGYGPADRSAVEGAIRSATFMPLRALIGQFPTTAEQWYLAYAESVAAVDFLVRRYGQPAMVGLVRSYADGVTDDEAFAAALGTDTAGFEAAWLAELGVPAPSPYGPREAPPGPVPSDWIGDAIPPGEIDGGSDAPSASATTGPGLPGEAEDPDSRGTAGPFGALVVLGLVLAVIGLWFARRNRPPFGSVEAPSGGTDEPAQGEEPEPAPVLEAQPDEPDAPDERVP